MILVTYEIKATRWSSDDIMHVLPSPWAQVALVIIIATTAASWRTGTIGAGFIHIHFLACSGK